MAKTQPKILATLQLPDKTAEWLGWNIVFKKWVTIEDIISNKPYIEKCLNDYLKTNKGKTAENLPLSFKSKMEATSNPLICTFKVKVVVKEKGKKSVPFNFPVAPIKKMQHFVLKTAFGAPLPPPPPAPPGGSGNPGGSHTNTVTIHPPTT